MYRKLQRVRLWWRLKMYYDELVRQLQEKIEHLEYVEDFKRVEQRLQEQAPLFEAQEEMKKLQKDAMLYREIGKMQAYKETSQAAQKIEKSLKMSPLVEEYFIKLQDVNDLVQYVTGEVERKVNILLENDEK